MLPLCSNILPIWQKFSKPLELIIFKNVSLYLLWNILAKKVANCINLGYIFQLVEELESLEAETATPDSPKPKPKKLHLNLDKKRDDVPSNWILLDVSFGIPLFDTSLNQKICKRFIENGLWRQSRWQK